MKFLLILSMVWLLTTAASPICDKYEGKYVSYYQKVYLVKNCRRHDSTKDAFKISKSGTQIHEVDASVVRQLPLAGDARGASVLKLSSLCKRLEKNYVSLSSTEVHYVDGCRKRSFLSWQDYEEHRRKHSSGIKGRLIFLKKEELNMLPTGKLMPATSKKHKNKIEERMSKNSKAKLCKNLEGKYVSYYRLLYHIKGCRKHLLSYEAMQKKGGSVHTELNTEQWKGIPAADGD